MSLDPEVRVPFERAVELVTAAVERDGSLMADLLAPVERVELAGMAMALAVFARDFMEEVCRMRGVVPAEAWPVYALACQRQWDAER